MLILKEVVKQIYGTMKYVKQFEKASERPKPFADINFLMKETLNAIKDKMDEICGKFATWELADESADEEEFSFSLYIKSDVDDEYVDENEVFYTELIIDYSNLEYVLKEQVIPLLENNGVFGRVSIDIYIGNYFVIECESGSMFKRGKSVGILDA